MKNEKIKKIIDKISIEGFKNLSYDDNNYVCHLMDMNDCKKWFKISLEINNLKEYTYIIIRFKINFIPVTQILNKVMGFEYRPEYPYLWENADTLTIGQELFLKINEEDIRPVLKHTMTDKDVSAFYNQIQFIYDEYLLPFISKYQDLQSVNDEIINKLPQMELGSIIPGLMHFKKQIIMKICNNENYRDYLEWLKGIYQMELANPNDRFYKQNVEEYEVFKKLTEYLERDDYKVFNNFS